MEKGWNASAQLRALLEARRAAGEKGWTQDWLADVTGIRRSTVNGNVTGRLPLGMTNAERYAKALGVTVEDLGAATNGRRAELAGWAESVEERLARMQAVLIRAGLVEDQPAGEGPPR